MLKYFGLIDKVLIWSDKEQPALSRELKLDWKRVSFGQSIGSVRKSPSLHSQKSTPTPKFLGTAKEFFVCYISPNCTVGMVF